MGRWTRIFFAAAAAAGQALASGAVGVQTLAVTQQGPWTITTSTLPGGSRALSINAAREIVGEGLSPDGLTIRPIWLDGATIGMFEGINGRPCSWNTQRHAVGRHVVNSKISCNVWWTPTASGPLDQCTGGAYDINESGEAAGPARFTVPTIHRHVVTWKSGAIHRDLGLPPGARQAELAGINEQGDDVGQLTDAATGRVEAFVYRTGQFTRLPSLAGQYAT